MRAVVDEFLRNARAHRLVQPGDRVLLAVSGGPDSVALLKLFLIVRRKLNLTLQVGHLNHGLRGKDSDRDEAFVRALCLRESVPFYSKKISGRSLRKRGASLEERARGERYRYLLGLARRLKAAKLATAHTLDDQAETVLMRLLRGSGLRGIGAIPAKRIEKGVWIIRPLLGVSKTDLAAFLRGQKLAARRDATNADYSFLRNRVRHELIPLVEKNYNPRFQKNLADLSAFSREFYDFLILEAGRAFRRAARFSGARVILSKRVLRCLHPALRKEIYFLAEEKVAGSRRSVEKSHAESVDDLLAARGAAEAHLPRRILVRADEKNLVFSRVNR